MGPTPPMRPATGFTRRIVTLALAACAFFAGGCGKSPEKLKAEQAAEVARTTGSLVVKSNLAEAVIKVTAEGGPGVREGTANKAIAALPPGRYAITASFEGWPEMRGEATVTALQTTEVTLKFPSGSLRLDSTPAGANVKLGTNVLGKTPLVVPQLPAGETALTFEYQSWPPVPTKVTITENQESTANVRLPHGKVVLDSIPSGATVFQGRPAAGAKPTVLGTTPLTLEAVPAGPQKYSFQLKNFPTIEVTITVADGKETKYSPALGSFFPVLDPAELLHEVWIPDDRSKITTGFNSTTGVYRPKNDIVKNLHRERLYSRWQHKPYRYTAQVKSYDPATGRIEFVEAKSDVARYRVLADVKSGATVPKDATVAVYGKLTAVEEPAWPGRVITLELTNADFLPDAK